MGNEKLDEVALNVLLADGVDVPTAYVASIRDTPPHREYFWRDKWIQAGMLIGLVLSILWLLR